MQPDLKVLVQKFIEAFNAGDFIAVDSMLGDNYIQHSNGIPSNRIAFLDFMIELRRALPDGKFEILDMLREGDKVFLRWSFSGTHTGMWFGQSVPTGKAIRFDGMDLWRFAEGKVQEIWFVFDREALQKQLSR
jgi:steroid delta-isomerase-like uncharacterized protein